MYGRIYTWRDRKGPWNTEPDKLQFTDEETGFECSIERHPIMGHLNGYVIIPKRNILRDIEIDEYNIDIHGGLSFFDEDCVGFDCAHHGDIVPITSDIYKDFLERNPPEQFKGVYPTYKNIEFVKAECKKLARQLKDLEVKILAKC